MIAPVLSTLVILAQPPVTLPHEIASIAYAEPEAFCKKAREDSKSPDDLWLIFDFGHQDWIKCGPQGTYQVNPKDWFYAAGGRIRFIPHQDAEAVTRSLSEDGDGK